MCSRHPEEGAGSSYVGDYQPSQSAGVVEALRRTHAAPASPDEPSTLRRLADACEGLLQFVRVGPGPLSDDPAAVAMREAFDALREARASASVPPPLVRQAALIEANRLWDHDTRTHAIRRDSFIKGAMWAAAYAAETPEQGSDAE